MIEGLIAWSVRNRFLVLLLTILTVAWGAWAVSRTPLDAIPDLSENQVIVFADWPGRSPQVVEDQITYPLANNLRGLPRVKTVRAQSAIGYSMIQVIFQDGVDLYWARTRVLERLSTAQGTLPAGVVPALGPDGTGVGHVYWYVLQGKGYDLGTLRALQDWYVRLALSAVPGVAEVASGGGFVREYQVDIDPLRLRSYGITLGEVASAIQTSNREVGGGLLEQAGQEFAVRGRGYLKGTADIEDIAVKTVRGTAVRVRDVATVQLGGAPRRGVLEVDGRGEAVVGVVVMRQGENAKAVIDRVKAKVAEISPGLPKGVVITPFYDRSELIMASVDTLVHTLIEEGVIVSIIILVFLLHLPSALTAIISIPMAVLGSFILMERLGITSNIMSLGGVAIAIGVLVDAAIVMVENAHRRLSETRPAADRDRIAIVTQAAQHVGRPIVFSLIIILVSFLPVFMLTGAEGKLFHPLAFTKSFSMGVGAILAVTLVPVLMALFMRGHMRPEEEHLLSRFFINLYRPVLRLALRWRWLTLGLALLVLLGTIPLGLRLGSVFMPDLDEGSLLFMPTTLPSVNITEAKRALQIQDRVIAGHPEVAGVLGKIGRVESPTDPAPVSMVETIVMLKARKDWPDLGMTRDDLIAKLDERAQIPGWANFWTMPIINRINMLATGVRTDLGLKILGADLDTLQRLTNQAERLLKRVEGTTNVYADRFVDGRYADIEIDRDAIARYGLSVDDVQQAVEAGLGGMTLTSTVEGRQRFPVRIRFARDLRDSIDDLARVELHGPGGQAIPLSAVARPKVTIGPPMISSENGLLSGVVFLNVRGRDMGSVLAEADRLIKTELKPPAGYFTQWTGQYENLVSARARLQVIVPLTVFILFVLLYMTFRNARYAGLIMLSVPFALVGGVLLQAVMKVPYSVAVWVGYIALAGVAIETGVVMLVYLEEALNRKRARGELTRDALLEATMEGAVLRLRPKLMTVFAALAGLLPILWATGTGSDVTRPIAIPMIGGLATSSILVLIVLPVLFQMLHERGLPPAQPEHPHTVPGQVRGKKKGVPSP